MEIQVVEVLKMLQGLIKDGVHIVSVDLRAITAEGPPKDGYKTFFDTGGRFITINYQVKKQEEPPPIDVIETQGGWRQIDRNTWRKGKYRLDFCETAHSHYWILTNDFTSLTEKTDEVSMDDMISAWVWANKIIGDLKQDDPPPMGAEW